MPRHERGSLLPGSYAVGANVAKGDGLGPLGGVAAVPPGVVVLSGVCGGGQLIRSNSQPWSSKAPPPMTEGFVVLHVHDRADLFWTRITRHQMFGRSRIRLCVDTMVVHRSHYR